MGYVLLRFSYDQLHLREGSRLNPIKTFRNKPGDAFPIA
jgi:hypothetical protein